MSELKDQLTGSSRVIEDMVSTLQSNIPELNQAKLILMNNALVIEDEIKWIENVQSIIAKLDEEFCNYDDFYQIITQVNVSNSACQLFIHA